MRRLDFISKSPKISIFRGGSNKTNLGGALYLIYILILIILAIIYIINYFAEDKYEFNYTLVEEPYGRNLFSDEEKKSMLTTNMDYFFVLGKDGGDIWENNIINNTNFIIIDNKILYKELFSGKSRDIKDGYFMLNSSKNSNNDECIIKQGTPITKNASTLILSVLYRCEKNNCTIRDDDKIKIDSYYLFMAYKGFSIEHQNPEKPIQPLPKNDYWLENIQFLNNTNIVFLNWQLIEYEEQKGIFGKTYDNMVGKSNIYYAGYYKSQKTYTDDGHVGELPDNDWEIKDLDGNHFKVLLYLESRPNLYEYERYSRKKISFLNVLASVAALGSTVLNLMSLAYGILYSENYDNYKIIENILTKKMKINIHSNDLTNEDTKEGKMSELKTDLIITENEKNDYNINDSVDENEEENNTKNNLKERKDLPIPKFFDFLFHKFYCKCCQSSDKQNLISSCNDLVAKYITIESILYNQMKLEYLWKDYKWNNPQNEINQRDALLPNLKAG